MNEINEDIEQKNISRENDKEDDEAEEDSYSDKK